MFLTIASRQVNRNLILGVEGCLPGQQGKVRLFLDSRAGAFLGGAPGVHYTAAEHAGDAATIELSGEDAAECRRQFWSAGSTMSAGG